MFSNAFGPAAGTRPTAVDPLDAAGAAAGLRGRPAAAPSSAMSAGSSSTKMGTSVGSSARPDFVREQAHRALVVQRLVIRALGRDRVEVVDDGQDARADAESPRPRAPADSPCRPSARGGSG